MKRGDADVQDLLHLIDEAYGRKAWHGPNLRGSVRRLSAVQATWRGGGQRYCIAEIVLHCAYWKYTVRRRLRGDKRGSFPLKGSNWFAVPKTLPEAEWKAHVALLETEHRALREAVAELRAGQLAATAGGATGPLYRLRGIALHDVYHAGQIQLIKGLWKRAAKRH